MPLTSVLLGWIIVTLWFLLWELLAARIERGAGWLRAPVWIYAGEALAVTLLGGLWFASLGSGAWPLVFGLLGVAIEWPLRLRGGGKGPLTPRRLVPVLGGVARLLGAGAVLAWRMV